MAKRGQSVEYVQWNQILDDVNRKIAREMGLDELPMAQKNFDYFSRGMSLLKRMSSSSGQDLEHDTAMVLQDLVFHIPPLTKGQKEYREDQKYKEGEQERRGPIYNYPKYLAKNGFEPEDFTFDHYFAMAFKRRARNQVEKRFLTKRTLTPHFPIAPGGQFDEAMPGGSVSENVLEDPASPAPSYRAEQAEKREILDKVIPEQLALIANERDSKILSEFYRMRILEGATLREIGGRLDQLGEQDSDYWPEEGGVDEEGNKVPWSTSTLNRYEDTIAKIMQRYYRQKKRERAQATTPEEKRAIFQSRRV